MDGSPAAGGFRRASALLSNEKSTNRMKTEDEVKEALGQLKTYFGYNSFRVGQVRGGRWRPLPKRATARRQFRCAPARRVANLCVPRTGQVSRAPLARSIAGAGHQRRHSRAG